MARKRTQSVPLTVDIDGIEIPACLRPPGAGRASYHVRWKVDGKWHVASTGTEILHEAKTRGRAIVRGEQSGSRAPACGLSIAEFETIQRHHYELKSVRRKGERSLAKFLGVWKGFLSVASGVKYIQEVDSRRAWAYVQHLKSAARDENYPYAMSSPATLSPNTVWSNVAVLRAAWNRVRLGHPRAKGGIPRLMMVTANPWEEVQNDLPERSKKAVVQFDLAANEFETLLDGFEGREVAQLFLIVSLWAVGRLEEVSEIQWDWIIDPGYISIPQEIAKKGYGKVIRVPSAVLERLRAVRVPESRYVFAGFADELRNWYLRKAGTHRHARKVLEFSPARLRWRMSKHIGNWANKKALAGVTHHAIRRTAMELSDEGELVDYEEKSAEKLRTTPANKSRNYLKRQLSKRHYLLADALYRNLTDALLEFPALAERLGVEKAKQDDGNPLGFLQQLDAAQKKKVLEALLAETQAEPEKR